MSAARRAALLCLSFGLGACGLFGGRSLRSVEDAKAVEFARRIDGFYAALEGVPIPAFWTYERPELRGYFAEQRAFDDYFASLALQVRYATLRDGRVERFEVEEFRLVDAEHAVVELRLVGRHQRALRFWGVELPRTDTWRLVEGSWLLTPERL